MSPIYRCVWFLIVVACLCVAPEAEPKGLESGDGVLRDCKLPPTCPLKQPITVVEQGINPSEWFPYSGFEGTLLLNEFCTRVPPLWHWYISPSQVHWSTSLAICAEAITASSAYGSGVMSPSRNSISIESSLPSCSHFLLAVPLLGKNGSSYNVRWHLRYAWHTLIPKKKQRWHVLSFGAWHYFS